MSRQDESWTVDRVRARMYSMNREYNYATCEVMTPHGIAVVYTEPRSTRIDIIINGRNYARWLDFGILSRRQAAIYAGRFAREIAKADPQ